MEMKRSLFAICLLAILTPALFLSCKSKSASHIENFDVCVYQPEYAAGFSIYGAKGAESVIIETRTPWQGASSNETTQLFISRNGELPPADFKGEVLKGDAKRIVCMSSTHVALLDALNEGDRIVGVSGKNFISSPSIRSRISEIGDVGYDSNINYELLFSLNPDIVLLYGVNGKNVIESKLKEIGIPFVYIGDYIEESPLGKAEWMVMMSEITGDRRKGEQIFSPIPINYNRIKDTVGNEFETHPKVMLNTPYSDSWVLPSSDSYIVQLINDAGADYIKDGIKGTQSRPIDMEEAYSLATKADYWINTGAVRSRKELTQICPKFVDVSCFVKGNVYNNTKRVIKSGGNDFWESGIVHPDLILRDLVKIFHPEMMDSVEFTYYEKLK